MAKIKDIRDALSLVGRPEKLRHQIKEVKLLSVQLKNMKQDILSDDGSEDFGSRKYTGNAYTSYSSAVAEISKKYGSRSNWGCILTGNIIDLRSVFIMAQGIKVIPREGVKKDEAEKELTWANDFLEFNDLDKEVAQDYAKEAEIEGKIALQISVKKIDKGQFKNYERMITARYISWSEKKYTIETSPDDPLDYVTLKWRPTSKTTEETLNREQFVYKKFGGRVNDPNEAQPKIMKCLTEIDNVTKALRDWREINRLFAAPIPFIQCDNSEQAQKMQARIDQSFNYKIKKLLALTGVFGYASPNMTGADSIEKEILRLVTFISGTTGVPIHWLGLTELLKQRATADDLREMINTGTTKERTTWEGAYQELLVKSMLKWNEDGQHGKGDGSLDPWKIRVSIPVISREQWAHIKDVLMPLALANLISQEALISQIPGIDSQDELKRLDEKATSEFERIKADNDRLNQDIANRDREARIVNGVPAKNDDEEEI